MFECANTRAEIERGAWKDTVPEDAFEARLGCKQSVEALAIMLVDLLGPKLKTGC